MADLISNHGPQAFHRMDVVTLPILPGHDDPAIKDLIIREATAGRAPHELFPLFPWPTPQPQPELPAIAEQVPVGLPVGPLPYPGQPEPSLIEQIIAAIGEGRDPSYLFPVFPGPTPQPVPELPAIGEPAPSPSIPGMMPGFVPGSQPGEFIPVGFPSIDSGIVHEIPPPRIPDNWAELLTP